MSLSYDEVIKRLAKLERDRALVKGSLVTDAMKARLLAEIDAQVAALSGSEGVAKTPAKG